MHIAKIMKIMVRASHSQAFSSNTMATNETDPRCQTAEELAGQLYNQMIRSKEATLACLSSSNYRIRIAAIRLCESFWKCGPDPQLIEACYSIAGSDAPDAFRMCGVYSLARILSSTKATAASRFLANLIMDSTNSTELRTTAYWALREIQFGLGDVDFDTFLKGMISGIKSILGAYPGKFSEDKAKSEITPQGAFPEGFWESADDIDWDFVAQFGESKQG